MKKLFLILAGYTATTVVNGNTMGNFTLLKDAKTGTVYMKTDGYDLKLKKVGITDPTEQYLDTLNIKKYEVTQIGNKETGAGYMVAVTFKEEGNTPQNTHYAKIIITTNAWNQATFTAQICDVNGNVTKTEAAAEKDKATQSPLDTFTEALKKGDVTGTTNLNIDQLVEAARTNQPLDIILTPTGGQSLNINVQVTNEGNNNFSANDEGVGFMFTAAEGTVTFNATVNVAAEA